MTINDCQPIPADVLAAFRPVTVYSPSIADVQRIEVPWHVESDPVIVGWLPGRGPKA